VIFAYLSLGCQSIGAESGTAGRFAIGQRQEGFSAMRAYLLQAGQSSMRRLVGTIRTRAGTVFALAVVCKLFSAAGASGKMVHVDYLQLGIGQATGRCKRRGGNFIDFYCSIIPQEQP